MLGYYLYLWNTKQQKEKKEGFSEQEENNEYLIAFMFSAVLTVFAIVLSWTCNSNAPLLLKVIYAFFAGFFGIFYLIFYFFYNYLGKQCGK